ncbi:MAG: ATP-binding protein [Bacteroidales bacterium]|nr:ATP-binding protein [Bacteroidales bacterium]
MKIAIASGKGGTGKTTISTNLAHYLSQTQEIILVDLDVEEPNSGLFIHGNLDKIYIKTRQVPNWEQENCILCGDCVKNCNFNAIAKMSDEIMIFPQLCHSCYACSELCPKDALPMIGLPMGVLQKFKLDKLHFIESKLDIGEEMAVPLIAQTVDFVEEEFDKDILRIYDSPPGTACPVIETLKHSDYVFLVTEPTPFGLNDLKLAVETVRKLEKDFAVIINRYGIGDNEVEKYCEEENIEITAKFPQSRKVAELYSSGELLYNKVPEFMAELEKLELKIKSIN